MDSFTFRRKLSALRSGWRRISFEVSSQAKRVANIVDFEDESDESRKAFYVLSLMLLLSLVFLAPDRIPQAFTLGQSEGGILEKTQDLINAIKRLIPNFS